MLDARKYWPQTWHQGIMVTLGSHAEYVNHCIELHLVPLLRKVPTCVDRDRASYHHITYLEMISNDIKRKLYIYIVIYNNIYIIYRERERGRECQSMPTDQGHVLLSDPRGMYPVPSRKIWCLAHGDVCHSVRKHL